MKTDIDKKFAALPFRSNYEEGRTLMNKTTEKIADKYHLSVVCMITRPDQPDQSLHIQNMSVDTMANLIVGLIDAEKNRRFMKVALAKVPDRIWIRALGIRFALFYIGIGIMVAGMVGMLATILPRITVQ